MTTLKDKSFELWHDAIKAISSEYLSGMQKDVAIAYVQCIEHNRKWDSNLWNGHIKVYDQMVANRLGESKSTVRRARKELVKMRAFSVVVQRDENGHRINHFLPSEGLLNGVINPVELRNRGNLQKNYRCPDCGSDNTIVEETTTKVKVCTCKECGSTHKTVKESKRVL